MLDSPKRLDRSKAVEPEGIHLETAKQLVKVLVKPFIQFFEAPVEGERPSRAGCYLQSYQFMDPGQRWLERPQTTEFAIHCGKILKKVDA